MRLLTLLAGPVESQRVGVQVTPRIAIKSHRNILLEFAVALVAFEDWLIRPGIPGGALLRLVVFPRTAGNFGYLDVREVVVLVQIAPHDHSAKEQARQNQPNRMR